MHRRHNDPHGSPTYVNPVNGVTKSVANISGHRDWAATECPGGKLYALLPTIRDTVAGSGNPPPMDTAPPAITAVKASATSNIATVTWATDELATSMLEYRRTRTSTWTLISVAGRRTSHSIMIGGLARRTSYEYCVTSIDAAGISATSTIASFKTR